MKKGDVSIYIIMIVIVFMIILLLFFSATVLLINVYIVVYDYKLNLYNLNKNAIMSVNNLKGSYGIYEYDKNEYLSEFKKALIKQYQLNESLENGNKNISKIEILEYEIYEKNDIDSITSKEINNNTIHVVTNIKYRPIIFSFLFKKGIIFKVHNDISIKEYSG
ncbi:MAG: hypothetical protein E7311_03645 [Clostridiales bacterium]|nr:hypothetical protein [Clostridiales bacterium]